MTGRFEHVLLENTDANYKGSHFMHFTFIGDACFLSYQFPDYTLAFIPFRDRIYQLICMNAALFQSHYVLDSISNNMHSCKLIGLFVNFKLFGCEFSTKVDFHFQIENNQ